MEKEQKQGNWFKRHKILSGVGAALILLIVLGVATSDGQQKTQTPAAAKQEAKYEAVVENYQVQDPATIVVRVKAHNVGSASGKPSCTVTADNGTRAYHGFDTFTREEDLGADGYWGFNGNITITNPGATYIKDVTVECK